MPTIRDLMTPDPVTVDAGASIQEAAQIMAEQDIGDVLVMDHEAVQGIVTDRDIAVRAVAEGRDPSSTMVGEICSSQVLCLTPEQDASAAVDLMREQAVRRIPVVDQGRPVGMLSIGDLALDLDSRSALADISAAPGNR